MTSWWWSSGSRWSWRQEGCWWWNSKLTKWSWWQVSWLILDDLDDKESVSRVRRRKSWWWVKIDSRRFLPRFENLSQEICQSILNLLIIHTRAQLHTTHCTLALSGLYRFAQFQRGHRLESFCDEILKNWKFWQYIHGVLYPFQSKTETTIVERGCEFGNVY